jgi:nitroreductase
VDVPVADPRLDAFRFAILAPNPHNRQPWMIELVGSDEAIIRCDLDRRLPETDPFDRQITIGFGCFLELARIAATSRGLRMDIAAFPDGAPEVPERLDRRPIAKVSFVRDRAASVDPHFKSVVTRRSSKVPFDLSRQVPARTLDTLRQSGVDASTDPGLVAKVRRLTWDAWMIEAQTARTHKESVDLMRIGKSEIEADPEGIALGGAKIEALALIGQISRSSLADPSSSAFKAGVEKYRPIMATAMGYAWIATTGNSRREQLDAGRRYVRMNLAANAAGLSVHPISQALQEYAEMRIQFNAAKSLLAVLEGSTLQMLARLGYADAQPPAPRWPIGSKVLKT